MTKMNIFMNIRTSGLEWGHTTLALAQLGFKVTALDIEPRFRKLIRERARRLWLLQQCQTQNGVD